jgi:hypothetical protein
MCICVCMYIYKPTYATHGHPDALVAAARGYQISRKHTHTHPPLTQTHTLLSRLQVATRFPDLSQATDLTSFSWPCRVAIYTRHKTETVRHTYTRHRQKDIDTQAHRVQTSEHTCSYSPLTHAQMTHVPSKLAVASLSSAF